MDRTLDVHTPESIAFSYELAGVGSRFLAVSIDLLVQLAVMSLIVWGIFALSAHAPGSHAPQAGGLERIAENVLLGLIIAVIFVVFFGYFIIFEALWNGQTPGKRALGIRVVRDGGYPVDFSASLIRNLIRVGELAAAFYAVAAIVSILSPENKRLGDMAAGTIVVRDARMASPQDLLRAVRAEPVYASTAYVTGDERAIIKRFLERRGELGLERRRELAQRIAERVRARLPEELRRLDDEDLLERL